MAFPVSARPGIAIPGQFVPSLLATAGTAPLVIAASTAASAVITTATGP